MSLLSAVTDNSPTLLKLRTQLYYSKTRSVDTELDSDYGCTALNLAALNGYEQCMSILMEHGGNLENRDCEGCTPLMNASIMGHVNCMQLLIRKGANVEAQDSKGMNALMHAAVNGRSEAVSLLLKYGASIDHVNYMGMTALQEVQMKSEATSPATAKRLLRNQNKLPTPRYDLCIEVLSEYARITNNVQITCRGDQSANSWRSASVKSSSPTEAEMSPRVITRRNSCSGFSARTRRSFIRQDPETIAQSVVHSMLTGVVTAAPTTKTFATSKESDSMIRLRRRMPKVKSDRRIIELSGEIQLLPSYWGGNKPVLSPNLKKKYGNSSVLLLSSLP